ncbi:hypothetical protein LCGC14_1165300 [marine sediment metagenome]|uniref:Uncharacterized protein n=1 Tax=marine sediment metagenome TaxID=412755 RepID=A0A0F9PWZ6_9ZZZZ
MNYKEAQKKATEIDNNLTIGGNNFNRIVHVVHQDGSTMLFHYAHVEDYDTWWFVFTEHTGWHVFAKEDLEWLHQYNWRT